MTLKHQTSSVFVFRRLPGGWRIGLIRHPRFRRTMIPGGHVEPEESPAEAAVREVAEETGLAVTLVSPPAAPVPPGYRARRVAPPWWIAEYQVPPDNHLDVAHVHVDHLYVALADGMVPAPDRALPPGEALPGAGELSPGGERAPGAARASGGERAPGTVRASGGERAPGTVRASGGERAPGAAALPFGWYAAGDLAGLDMFDDARVLALSLLAGLANGADTVGAAEALVAGLGRA